MNNRVALWVYFHCFISFSFLYVHLSTGGCPAGCAGENECPFRITPKQAIFRGYKVGGVYEIEVRLDHIFVIRILQKFLNFCQIGLAKCGLTDPPTVRQPPIVSLKFGIHVAMSGLIRYERWCNGDCGPRSWPQSRSATLSKRGCVHEHNGYRTTLAHFASGAPPPFLDCDVRYLDLCVQKQIRKAQM